MNIRTRSHLLAWPLVLAWSVLTPPPLAAGADLPAARQAEMGALLRRAMFECKRETPVNERVAMLVEAGPDMRDFLAARVRRGELDGLSLTALGFLAGASDVDAVAALEGVAFKADGPFRRFAIESLMRIGAAPARGVLDRVADGSLSGEYAQQVVDESWMLRDDADLKRAADVLGGIAQDHPDAGLRVFVRESCLPRIQRVLEVRRRPQAADTGDSLARILLQQDPAFVTVAGGYAEEWAIERLVAGRLPQAERTIRVYLAERDAAAVQLSPALRAAALRSLRKIGGALNAEQSAWLREQAQSDERPLALYIDRDQLLNPPAGRPQPALMSNAAHEHPAK